MSMSFRSPASFAGLRNLLRKFHSGSDGAFECNLMAKSFEASDEIAGEALGLQAVKEVAAEVGIGRAPFEHMVEDDQQRMPDRHQGSFHTPASDQAPILRGQVSMFGVAGG